LVIGGGGTSIPSNQLFFNPPACRVITAVGDPDPKTGKRPPVYVKEQAPWSAVRNAARMLMASRHLRLIQVQPVAAPPRSRSRITTWWDRTVNWPRSKPLRCSDPAAISAYSGIADAGFLQRICTFGSISYDLDTPVLQRAREHPSRESVQPAA
jgi:hypothetical protein